MRSRMKVLAACWTVLALCYSSATDAQRLITLGLGDTNSAGTLDLAPSSTLSDFGAFSRPAITVAEECTTSLSTLGLTF